MSCFITEIVSEMSPTVLPPATPPLLDQTLFEANGADRLALLPTHKAEENQLRGQTTADRDLSRMLKAETSHSQDKNHTGPHPQAHRLRQTVKQNDASPHQPPAPLSPPPLILLVTQGSTPNVLPRFAPVPPTPLPNYPRHLQSVVLPLLPLPFLMPPIEPRSKISLVGFGMLFFCTLALLFFGVRRIDRPASSSGY